MGPIEPIGEPRPVAPPLRVQRDRREQDGRRQDQRPHAEDPHNRPEDGDEAGTGGHVDVTV